MWRESVGAAAAGNIVVAEVVVVVVLQGLFGGRRCCCSLLLRCDDSWARVPLVGAAATALRSTGRCWCGAAAERIAEKTEANRMHYR